MKDVTVVVDFKNEKTKLLRIYALVFLGNYFSRIFVNTFLYGNDGNIYLVLLYNLLQYFTIIPMALIIEKIKEKLGLSFLMRFGILLFSVFYLSLLFQKNHSMFYVAVFSILLGCGNAMFFVSYNGIVSIITDNSDRSSFICRQIATSTLGSLIPPLLSGYIIQNIAGIRGYQIVFLISCIMYFLAFIKAGEMAKYHKKETKSIGEMTIALINTSNKYVEIGEFFKYFRDGSINYLMTILIFDLVRNEFMIGSYSFLCSIGAIIIANVMSKKTFKKENILIYCPILILILTVAFEGIKRVELFWVLGIVISLLTTIYSIVTQPLAYEATGNLDGAKDNHICCSAIREIVMNLGRTCGIICVLFLIKAGVSMQSIIIILATVQLVASYFYRIKYSNFALE